MAVAAPRRLPAAVVAAGVLAATLAGCGSSGKEKAAQTKDLTPQQALSQSVSALDDRDALAVTLKVAVSTDDLKALSAKGSSGKPLTDAQARLITGGDVQITARTSDGSKLKDAKPGTPAAVAVAVHTDGGAIVEFRSVDGKALFLRADVKKIVEIAGKPASSIDAQLANVPPQLSFLKDAVAGKWLKLDVAALQNLAKTYGGSAIPSADPSAAAAARSKLLAALQRDVTATRAAPTDRGDHLVLTGSTRTLAKDVVGAFTSAFPSGNAALSAIKTDKVPDTPVTLDAFVKDGRLSVLSLDVSQFATGKAKADFAGKPFPLEMTFSSDVPKIDAPADAVTVDLQQILGAFLGARGGSARGGSSSTATLEAPASAAPTP